MKTQSIELPIYTEAEFLEVVRKNLDIDAQSLIEGGFNKWDKDNIEPFIKSICFHTGDALYNQYLIDIGDAEVMWLVVFSKAVVVMKKLRQINH